ncbi:MAG: hypothetical protein SFT94_10210, partial [Pseudanabaenaceae cyanobacterium bins.68]|nr:hypothetical protein [Pseudanabaenaceae cyanobacterium bins.68]
VDLNKAIVQIMGEVVARSAPNRAEIRADQAEWSIEQQQIKAEGNVSYAQVERNIQVQGNNAIADLANQTVNVRGNGGVITKISVP